MTNEQKLTEFLQKVDDWIEDWKSDAYTQQNFLINVNCVDVAWSGAATLLATSAALVAVISI